MKYIVFWLHLLVKNRSRSKKSLLFLDDLMRLRWGKITGEFWVSGGCLWVSGWCLGGSIRIMDVAHEVIMPKQVLKVQKVWQYSATAFSPSGHFSAIFGQKCENSGPMWRVKMDSKSKNSFFPDLIYWNHNRIHLGTFKKLIFGPMVPPLLQSLARTQFWEILSSEVVIFDVTAYLIIDCNY